MIEIGGGRGTGSGGTAGGTTIFGAGGAAPTHVYGAGGAGIMKPLPEEFDPVNRPEHYNSHPSGIQCIEVTRHMSFNLGNVIKYLWRADLKNGTEDLEKAAWYLADEIAKRKANK